MRRQSNLALAVLASLVCASLQATLRTKLLFRFTDMENDGQSLGDNWVTVGVSALMAVDMFNQRDGTLIKDLAQLGDCDVYLEDAMYDTQSTPVGAMSSYIAEPHDIIVGAPRSASSESVAIMGGIEQNPQISFWSTSPEFDNKLYYPYFMRTIPSDEAIGDAIVTYLSSNDFRAIHVMYVDDSYGSSYARALALLGDAKGVHVNTVGFIAGSTNSIDEALNVVAQSQLRIVLLVAFEADATYTLELAQARGMVNDEFLWIYTDSVPDGWFKGFSEPSWLQGHMRMLSIGGVPTHQLWIDYQDYFRSITDLDARYTDRLPDGVTCPDNLLDTTYIDDISAFSFDAVIALGLGACAAEKATGGVAPPDLLNYTYHVGFDGVSGRVEFDEYGSRKASTGNFMLQNVQMKSDGTLEVKTIGSWSVSDGWQLAEQPIYPSGTSEPPSFVAIPDEEYHYLGDIVIAGYLLFGVHAFASLVFAAWVVYNRETKVVKRAQPVFLLLIIFGTLISSSTLLSLSFGDDEDVDLEQKSEDVWVSDKLDVVCQTIPWLYCIGFITTFSALLAKIKRIEAVFINPLMKKVTIRPVDALRITAPIFLAELIILIFWQVLDPLEWERKALSSDRFGNPEESIGRCVNGHPWLFIGPILAVHVLGTAYSLRLAYKVRDVSTDFQEGKWISVALFCNFQILLLAVPLFFLVNEDPRASYLLRCDIIFLNDFSVLCLIFIPKVLKLWLRLKDGVEQGDVPTVQGMQLSSITDRPMSWKYDRQTNSN